MFAFFPSLGWEEMFLLLVIGLLLYGRNLPEAGRNLGRLLAQLKRGFDEFKQQIDRDADLREMKDSLKDAARDLRKVADVPRAIGNPVQSAMTVARDALTKPMQGAQPAARTTPAATEPTVDAEAPPAAEHPPTTTPQP